MEGSGHNEGAYGERQKGRCSLCNGGVEILLNTIKTAGDKRHAENKEAVSGGKNISGLTQCKCVDGLVAQWGVGAGVLGGVLQVTQDRPDEGGLNNYDFAFD